MSKNDANEKYLSSEMRIKSKLNSLWSELQENLPEINFDADDDENTDLGIENKLIHIEDDDFEQIEREFLKPDGDDDWQLVQHSDILEPNKRDLDIFSPNNVSKHIQLLNGNAEKELKSLKKMEESVASAVNITKNIFEPVSSKLNMDLLNNLKIDDDDENQQKDYFTTHERQFYEKKKASKVNEKEKNLMEKLHAMSQAFSSENPVAKKEESVVNESSISALDMLERNLIAKSKYQYPTDLSDWMNGPPSGNFIETRKIDLRPKTVEKKEKIVQNMLSKKPFMMHKDSAFDESSSCSSDTDSRSDDDGENGSSLWIERYRRQKLLSAKANNKK